MEQDNHTRERRIRQHIRAKNHEFYAVYPPGFEKHGKYELQNAGITEIINTEKGGITFHTKIEGLYRATLECRGAVRFLMRIASFKATGFAELGRHIASIPWELYLPQDTLPKLHVSTSKSRLYHSDAVAEQVLLAIKKRLEPISNTGTLREEPSQAVFVRIADDRATVSLDCSGTPLYMRGYKLFTAHAPLRENLAALILEEYTLGNYDTICDPMCGSGTFPIEAALQLGYGSVNALRGYPFEQWPVFSEKQFAYIKKESMHSKKQEKKTAIYGFDLSAKNIDAAGANAERAHCSVNEGETGCTFAVRDFFTLTRKELGEGRILFVCNPPYGKRLDRDKNIVAFYKQIGTYFKTHFKGCDLALIVPGTEVENQLGLKYEKKIPFMNGGLPVAVLFIHL